eukprot:scaffold18_cov401-Prasinococcus_capsulatus_cf.AAC.14
MRLTVTSLWQARCRSCRSMSSGGTNQRCDGRKEQRPNCPHWSASRRPPSTSGCCSGSADTNAGSPERTRVKAVSDDTRAAMTRRDCRRGHAGRRLLYAHVFQTARAAAFQNLAPSRR